MRADDRKSECGSNIGNQQCVFAMYSSTRRGHVSGSDGTALAIGRADTLGLDVFSRAFVCEGQACVCLTKLNVPELLLIVSDVPFPRGALELDKAPKG